VRAPLSWIRDFTPVDAPPEEIAGALDQLGLEVERIDDPGAAIGGVVVARVLAVEPHPDADKLALCDVDFGGGETRVVCGAPNVYPGMLAPLARPGARLPGLGGTALAARTIRGVRSDGMLCSARELGLGDDHSGIVDLAELAEVDAGVAPGADIREVLGLDDVVFELSITPNRPDAMSIVGIARELAAHFGRPLDLGLVEQSAAVGEVGGATVVIEAPDRCPRLTARVARVALGPSPEWLQRRLRLAGMRPISNVVDVTNYVMLERGRPLHAFDLHRMAGPGILVRLASDGERITTLDGVERLLTADDLLICDLDRTAQAIAGVMGGATAEVSSATTAILLESAHFAPEGIARTSKRLGLRSEASARFERGVDPESTLVGADLAMRLLADVAQADVEPGAVDAYPAPVVPPRITVRPPRVNQVLGTDLARDDMARLLAPLGITVEIAGDDLITTPPTWRPDLEREIDIVEEVARRHGLARIERSVPVVPGLVGGLDAAQRDRRLVADTLVGAGYDEAFTLPLVSPADLERVGLDTGGAVEVENPLRAEESLLRPAILPGLLRAVAHNAGFGTPDVALFEIGTVFAQAAATGARTGRDAVLPDEHQHLCAVRAGRVVRTPHEADRPVDAYDAVAVAEALRDALRLADLRTEAAALPGLHPTRGARVVVDGRFAGAVGEVDAPVLDAFGIEVPVVALEVDVDALLRAERRPARAEPVSRYPAASIDLAFAVADDVPAAAVASTLRGAGGALLESVRLFDVFRSEALGAGRVSLAFALRFRAPDRTLTDDDVAALRRECIAAVEHAHGAQLRG
jgi:phenylalanyl-tRNA synthetase beta chain